jgi:LysM repeat protein
METLAKTIQAADVQLASLLVGTCSLLLALAIAVRIQVRSPRRPRGPRSWAARLASLLGFAVALSSPPVAAHSRKSDPPYRPTQGAAPPWSASGETPPRSPEQAMVTVTSVAPVDKKRGHDHDSDHGITLDEVLTPATPASGRRSELGTVASLTKVELPHRRVPSDAGPAHPVFHGRRVRDSEPLFPRYTNQDPISRSFDGQPPSIAVLTDRDAERERLTSMRAHPAGRALVPQMAPNPDIRALANGQPEHRAPVEKASRATSYEVQAGDTLWSIAQEHLGTDDPRAIARYWPLIHRQNRELVGDNPDLIVPGQRLQLP